MTSEEIEAKYICPLCIKKGWRRKIEVEFVTDTDWQWRCTYRKCDAAGEWQLRLEPVLDRKARAKIGDK